MYIVQHQYKPLTFWGEWGWKDEHEAETFEEARDYIKKSSGEHILERFRIVKLIARPEVTFPDTENAS